jgi:uncharacterized membrane protein YdjX (TVP38/TMEM64 family)
MPRLIARAAACLSLLAGVLLVSSLLPREAPFRPCSAPDAAEPPSFSFSAWAQALPLAAAVAVVIAATALGLVLLVPATPLNVASGALFGPATGVLISWFAVNLGAALAFLIGRHLLASFFRRRLGRQNPGSPPDPVADNASLPTTNSAAVGLDSDLDADNAAEASLRVDHLHARHPASAPFIAPPRSLMPASPWIFPISAGLLRIPLRVSGAFPLGRWRRDRAQPPYTAPDLGSDGEFRCAWCSPDNAKRAPRRWRRPAAARPSLADRMRPLLALEPSMTLIALTRSSPLFPFPWLNYAYGAALPATHFAPDYLLGTAVGTFPGTALSVFIGSITAALVAGPSDDDAGSAEAAAAAAAHARASHISLAVSLVASIAAMVAVSAAAGRAFKRAAARQESVAADRAV